MVNPWENMASPWEQQMDTDPIFDPYFGLDPEMILAQVRQEYKAWLDFVISKRDLFRRRLALYSAQKKTAEKLHINTIYSVIQTLLSLYYTDEISVKFVPREFGDNDLAANLGKLAKFDYDEMELDKLNYQVQWDRFFFGVGIRIRTGWDDNRKLPMFRVADPLTWIPDPDGDAITWNFRFHGFVGEMSKQDMDEEKWFFNVDLIGKLKDDERQKDKLNYAANNGLTQQNNDLEQNWLWTVYNHYTTISGIKFLVTTANNNNLIIRLQPINPVGGNEKEDPILVPFPVILNYYSPLRWDPFGVSVPDLLEDKQRAKSILANLRLIKEKRNALGWEFLYDPTMIKNRNDLITPTLGPKYIPVDASMKSINAAITEVQRSWVSASSFEVEQNIQKEESIATWIDYTQTNMASAMETNQNSLSRFMLGYKVNSWWEKDFWYHWYRSYKEFFSSFDQKIIRILGWLGLITKTFIKEDFLGSKDPDIFISSKSMSDMMNQKEKSNFFALYPITLQDNTIPTISKKFALRKLYELNWISEEEIKILVPYTYEELQALEDLKLINKNIPIEVVNMEEDHLSFIIIYATALDNDAKIVSIQNRKEALIKSGQLQKIKENEQNNSNPAIMNMASAQLFARASQ